MSRLNRLGRMWSLALQMALSATLGCAPTDDRSGREWIVFASSRSGDGDLYAVPADGGGPVLLVGTEASEGTPRWDPYRGRIVHSRFDSVGATLMSGDEELLVDPNGDVAPVWAPDGRIAFVLEESGGVDVYVAEGDGANPRRVTNDSDVERYPSWDPSGERLVYAKRLSTGWDLHVLDVAGGAEERVTFEGVYVGHPSWGPGGERIAFDRMYGDQTEIVVLDLPSGEMRRLTDNQENDLIPSWSSDGERVAFGGVRADNWDVWLVGVDGGALRRLTTDAAFDGGPIFVPDDIVSGAGRE